MIKPKETLKKFRLFYRWLMSSFLLKTDFGKCGSNTILQYPLRIYNPKSVFIEENVKISSGLQILNAPNEKVVIKKYTVFAANCTIAPNNHVPTVTVPQFLLGASHVNDISTDVVIDEGVWIGTNVTILAGVHIGRGCIVGAGSLVTKSLPPYSVAVGSPARIVKKVFSVDQILCHEQALYQEKNRFSREFLEELDEKYFRGMSIYGTGRELDSESRKRIEKIKSVLGYISPNL